MHKQRGEPLGLLIIGLMVAFLMLLGFQTGTRLLSIFAPKNCWYWRIEQIRPGRKKFARL